METKMETQSDDFICLKCNKTYKNRSGLWKHNINKHSTGTPSESAKTPPESAKYPPESAKSQLETIKKNTCKYCDYEFTRSDSLRKHYLRCKIKNNKSDEKDKIIEELKKENELFKKEFEIMKTQMNEILNKHAKIHPKTLQKINKQLHNEGNIGAVGNNNNVIHNTFVKFGDIKLENLLDEKQIISIFNKQFYSLEESILLTRFNKDLPEYNNIFITNMRDNLAYIFDGTKFIAVDKNDVIGKLISNHSDELVEVFEDYKSKLNKKIARHVEGFLKLLNDGDEYVDVNNKTHESYQAYKISDIKRLIYDNSDAKKLAELKKIPLFNMTDNDNEIEV